MGDRGRQLAHRRDAVGVRELEFRLAVSLLVFASFCFCRPQCRNIGAGAAITAEFSVGVKHWLAADFIINQRSVASCGPVDEIAERLTRLEHRPMKLPLFRLRFHVHRELPPRISSFTNRDPRGGLAAENCGETESSPGAPIRKFGTFPRSSTAPFHCGDRKPNCPYASASALRPN